MSKIYLGLGTNLGDKEDNLKQAIELLSEKVENLHISSLYETEPVGFKEQPWFLNLVLEGDTDLPPQELLHFTQSIEKKMKRIKTILNGPRIIDIDILLYEQEQIEIGDLIIPHPRLLERAFVMVPLYEIAPDLIIFGKRIKDIMRDFNGERIIKKD
ncbi:2-amino-4-hydroxy-6-hydroxymethyldihydropteridine diphosphokinase [Clostridium aminobutyricum]|uniref:2-amino-4-hydroxy-6-hydroxymethyldihydropteridine diphosphokinase n=1 Tax=Clostridium aminobutyricum TaxID=33953 RepID=A0A939D662_CLOAM|nr:2-amino-4-hydroxy-6-hydroxymethyldihydropteridine diphosphokinase [Clostridium aminobutyricum]MBN7771770.1 2-amino-4-hydroxy-6-hydroxymethyldihydropteridine diphosphokinase [Clostridium aminobutyricum]